MGHTYTNLLTHVIFSTKDRIKYLRETHRNEVFSYMGGIARNIGAQAVNIGGYDDHVHLLIKASPSLSIADVVRVVKTNSSRWIHATHALNPAFAWQDGYSAFSVSESCVGEVVAYISRQAEHHRKVTFQEELIAYLKRNGVAYDERYIWS